MARLDKVAPMKVIAQTAAAIGREFQLDLLEAVADARPEEVRGAIEGLLSAGLVFEHGDGARAYAFNHALVQEAAYSSMLREERRELHRRIAQALGEKFPDIVESHPELVAYHHSQARQMEAAVGFWLKAAQQAIKRSAFIEAVAHLQAALAQLADVPQSEQRDRLELQLQEFFVSASIAAYGFGSAQTTDALTRALELCERSGDHLRTISVLNGMVGVHMMRGEFEKSLSVSQSLLERAETRSDATALLMSHRVLGMSLFTLGRIEEARAHLRKAIALYDPARHAPLAVVFSHDFRATAEAYLGLATVVAGHAEAGLGYGHAALAYAEELRHPHSICYVLPFLTGAYLVAGRPREALPLAERTITLSSQYVFPQWQAGGLMLRGWARIDLGEAEGVEDVRKAIAGLEATGTLIWMRFAQFQLARGIALSGDRQAAATLIEQNLRHLAGTSGRWYEAEVHRFKGDLIAEGDGPEAEAAHSYEAAIDCAKRQGALLFQFHAMKALLSLRGARGNASALEAQATALRAELDQRSGVGDLQKGAAGALAMNEGVPTEQGAAPGSADGLDADLGERFYEGSREAEERHTGEIIQSIKVAIDRRVADGEIARRDAHAFDNGCMRAIFQVDEKLDPRLAQGIFQPGRRYRAWIRVSNGNTVERNRWFPDARGFAIKLMSVPGPKLTSSEKFTQDFILISHPVFFVDNLDRYNRTLIEFLKGGIVDQYVRATRQLRGREIYLAFASNLTWLTNPLFHQYWSMTPYRLGVGKDRIAVKYSVKPRAQRPPFLSRLATFLRPGFTLKGELNRTLNATDVSFDFYIQRYVDERTPIEELHDRVARKRFAARARRNDHEFRGRTSWRRRKSSFARTCRSTRGTASPSTSRSAL